MQRLLTDRIFASALACTYKCFLQMNDHHGTRSEYEQHIELFDAMYQTAALNCLRTQHSRSDILCAESLVPSVLTLNRKIVVIKHVKAKGVASDAMVLIRNTDSFEPVFFFRYEEISSRERLLLAYKAMVFGKANGIMPTHGRIVHGDEFSNVRVNLTSLIPKAEQIIHDIDKLSVQKEQPLFLCAHCDICEFLTACRAQAVEEDNMSLLQGMHHRQIEEQNKKGIFTLHQFSHTFRPRRAPKRAKNPSKPRHFALQAQALRENKVYIHGTPSLPSAETTIYFDIEGIPGRRLYYLIGMLVLTGGKETYHCFWADGKNQQADIFRDFCESVAKYPGAALFHYGQYDVRALRDIKPDLGNGYDLLMDNVMNSCHNVLSVLHPHCYFPVYSNRLRDVARFLGYEFKSKILTGIESIMYRERWEKTADTALRDALIAYNREDCEALRLLCSFMRESVALASGRQKVPGRNEEVAPTESLRRAGEGNRPVFRKPEFAYPEFEFINKCAYFDYQRDHVFARTQRLQRKVRSGRAHKIERKASSSTVVSVVCKRCLLCGSRKIIQEKTVRRWLIDLKYFKSGIGVKRWQPRYLIRQYHCRACGETFLSPDLPFNMVSHTIYGHGLISWCVYHNIVGKQPMLQVLRGLKDIFNLNIVQSATYRVRRILASYYRPLCDEILASLLSESVLHVDETQVKLRKTTAYVWVLSSATKVHYLVRDSRESTFLQELLGGYNGVLVSDFFTGYDSLRCRQQKCLVHLMRDLNDDLRRNPYDEELRSMAQPFAKLLKEIVLTIDRYGLRRSHLHKHVKSAESFCSSVARRHFSSDHALKYQKRFEKYGDRLFTFLHYDGVPWNNNNAEHGIHYFAKLRRFGDGMFTKASLEDILTVLTVLQTCEYNRISPLKFLLSGKNQLHFMKRSPHSRLTPVGSAPCPSVNR